MPRRRLLGLALVAIVLACVCARACGDGPADPTPSASPPPAAAPPPPGPAAPALPPPDRRAGPESGPAGPGDDTGPDGSGEARDDSEGVVTGAETLDGAAVPEVVRAAERFAAAWTAPDPGWPEPVRGLVTPALAEALAHAAEPPEREITGGGFLLFDAPRWARVGVPTADGTLVLDLSQVHDRWLVSAVAWWSEPVEVSG